MLDAFQERSGDFFRVRCINTWHSLDDIQVKIVSETDVFPASFYAYVRHDSHNKLILHRVLRPCLSEIIVSRFLDVHAKQIKVEFFRYRNSMLPALAVFIRIDIPCEKKMYVIPMFL